MNSQFLDGVFTISGLSSKITSLMSAITSSDILNYLRATTM
jgi:hypothetical protein